jgi:AraC-like DNA-binding protein
MGKYTNRDRQSSRIALSDLCVAIANAHNPRVELQCGATTAAHMLERHELPREYVIATLEAAAQHAGLSDREIQEQVEAAFHFARCGVIRTHRRRVTEVAA